MKTAAWSGVARFSMGCSMLVACGGGDATPDLADTTNVAGGETSEFSSGDMGLCPEIVSDTPLDLEQSDIAAAAALAAGHHELGMAWKNEFATDIAGFEEHTQLELDVTVLRGRELVYGSGGYEGAEVALCDETTATQLELEVSLQTADGALAASFRHWVEVFGDPTDPGRSRLFSAQVREPNYSYDAASFTSAIDLELDPALGGSERLGVYLRFDAESVGGYLAPFVSLPPRGARDYDATWAPVMGSFPDDGCGPYHRPVGLDEVRSELGGTTPRAAFEISLLRQGTPMAAAWDASALGSIPTPETLTWTEVSVTAGAPTHACQEVDIIQIHTALSVETADGRLSVTQPGEVALRANGGHFDFDYVSSRSSWIPTEAFEGATGMNLDSNESEYGALELFYWRDADGIEGNLSVEVWQDFESGFSDQPGLHWCAGAKCDRSPYRAPSSTF